MKKPTDFCFSSPKTAKQSAQLFQGVPALPGASSPGAATVPVPDSFWEEKGKPHIFRAFSKESISYSCIEDSTRKHRGNDAPLPAP